MGRLFGLKLPAVGKRGTCPIREHKRHDRTFTVFKAPSGDILWRCYSCDSPNSGDAVSLYGALAGLTNVEAFKELIDKGLIERDRKEGSRESSSRESYQQARVREVTPLSGDRGSRPILPLDRATWRRWKAAANGAVSAFAAKRGLSVETMIEHDVVQVNGNAIGFGYRDPATMVPCRVKVRSVDRKQFYIEPRGPGGDDARKALAPLYLAHELPQLCSPKRSVVITEGEIDCLTLKHHGFVNVVSLPDGADSAAKVDLTPLSVGYHYWLIATDADEAGSKAYGVLRQRALANGIRPVRIYWRAVVDGELVTYKDANDALLGGFGRDDFETAIQRSAERGIGYKLEVLP